mgnify:CR=1 FL=1
MNSSLIDAAYQVNALFLLLGENNLPNAVAALTLTCPGGEVYLIYTDRTQAKAENLRDFLQGTGQFGAVHGVDLAAYQSEPSEIRKRLAMAMLGLSGRVGMNYTGGTKAMAVHAYGLVAERYPDAVFSYLDSNTSTMVVDNPSGPSPRFKIPIKLSLKSLLQIYGLQWKADQPPRQEPLCTAAATDFMRLHQDYALGEEWRCWCNQVLRRVAKSDRFNRWLEEWELAQLDPLRMGQLSPDWVRVLQRHFAAGVSDWNLRAGVLLGEFAAEPSPLAGLCQWLDGVWLEHYTLAQVQQIAEGSGIHEAKMSLNIANPQNLDQSWAKFEFDVAFMQGYQLFALSCSATHQRGLCKSKLLEARTRSQQMGGIEARFGLVCLARGTKSLQQELATETRDRRVAVFGRADLPLLGQKIRAWVAENS